jgi:hypothetical protein
MAREENPMIPASRSPQVLALLMSLGLCSAAADAGLIHRYSFDGPAVKDSVGKVDATLKGAARVEGGKLVLDNGEKTSGEAGMSYLQFDAPVIPKEGSATLVVWVTAKQNPLFSRVIDIGDTENGEGAAFIYLVAQHEDTTSRAAITSADTGSKTFVTGQRLDDDKPHMAALVIDGKAGKLHLYVDGHEAQPPEDLGENTLKNVKPAHSYLGRSSFDADPGLTVAIDEFRVYDEALSAEQVNALVKAGPSELPATMPSTAPAAP